MVLIGAAAVEDDVLSAEFACDLGECRGACCVLEGGRGAPLNDGELPELERAFGAAAAYIPPAGLEVIHRVGLWEGFPGDFVTPCVGRRECVYAWFDGPVARCALERAYLEGRTGWRKPLSCHLFPLRIARRGGDHVRYERIPECLGGRVRGVREHIPLLNFLREPLVRQYGESWYMDLLRRSGRS